jgi:Fe-S oxidoreductase
MKIGKPVFRRMAESEPDVVCSDCPIAGRHIAQGIAEEPGGHPVRKEHPLTLVRKAYGL